MLKIRYYFCCRQEKEWFSEQEKTHGFFTEMNEWTHATLYNDFDDNFFLLIHFGITLYHLFASILIL